MSVDDTGPTQGPVYIFLAVVIGISLIGFLTATRSSDYTFRPYQPEARKLETSKGEYRSAPTYTELRRTPRGEGSGWTADVDNLNAAMPAINDAVAFTGSSKSVDLAFRAMRRAYDGAPPVIPHPIRQNATPECRNCHDNGLQLGKKRAPQRPHDLYTSCTQCHVVAVTPMPGGFELPVDPRDVPNSFKGTSAPKQGPRAWSIAPPQIPHKSFMHEKCISCHGVNGRDAIRTPHPWRASCTQCHAPSAQIDRRPGVPAQ